MASRAWTAAAGPPVRKLVIFLRGVAPAQPNRASLQGSNSYEHHPTPARPAATSTAKNELQSSSSASRRSPSRA